eukprot:TRINITY_DN436_c0_g1_i10.p1 TRINITY_DN436_c0_g1~~TRINITY_DN436_c0_g1_i10.p1  ORF type:complete len:123 (+),score=34.45 TRINITY_DN436_c0_g1_i10:242-610(+)
MMSQRLLLCAALAMLALASSTPKSVQESASLNEGTVSLGEAGDHQDAAALKAKLKELDKTYDRIKSSCAANSVGPSAAALQAMQAKQDKTMKAEDLEALTKAIKEKNALIDKIADECMPGKE